MDKTTPSMFTMKDFGTNDQIFSSNNLHKKVEQAPLLLPIHLHPPPQEVQNAEGETHSNLLFEAGGLNKSILFHFILNVTQ